MEEQEVAAAGTQTVDEQPAPRRRGRPPKNPVVLDDDPDVLADVQASPPAERTALVGDMVWYWIREQGDKLRPLPAMLVQQDMRGGWSFNFWRVNMVSSRRNVPWSDSPREGHWTFRDVS